MSDSANIKPEEVRRVEVVVVSCDLEKVGLLTPHCVELSVVADPLLRVHALLMSPLLFGQHVVDLCLIIMIIILLYIISYFPHLSQQGRCVLGSSQVAGFAQF